ncbi:MAG: type II toxin-antitoxin system Phd/YefM family antitoxin [Terriglobales bacterium]
MDSVDAFDAKTHLNELLERVSQGATIQITRRGVPVARLVPPDALQPRHPWQAAKEIRALRKAVTLGGVKLRGLINEGRRH